MGSLNKYMVHLITRRGVEGTSPFACTGANHRGYNEYYHTRLLTYVVTVKGWADRDRRGCNEKALMN